MCCQNPDFSYATQSESGGGGADGVHAHPKIWPKWRLWRGLNTVGFLVWCCWFFVPSIYLEIYYWPKPPDKVKFFKTYRARLVRHILRRWGRSIKRDHVLVCWAVSVLGCSLQAFLGHSQWFFFWSLLACLFFFDIGHQKVRNRSWR